MKVHRMWCNCDRCVAFRGSIVPEWRVALFEAQLRQIEARPVQFIIDDPTYVFDPPLEASHLQALERAMPSASIFPQGSRVGLWEPTAKDVRFLKSLGIAPT
jgi:hypothetical protein